MRSYYANACKSGAILNRRNILLLLIIMVLAGNVSSQARAQTPLKDAEKNAEWLQSLQFTNPNLPGYGGIRVHHTPGATNPKTGKMYFRVSPYSANLAVSALLNSHYSSRLKVAGAWIDWFFAHLTPQSAPDGVPCEHFYLIDGSGETVTVVPGDPRLDRYNDATDSAAATFFCVLRDYVRAGGSERSLKQPGRRDKVVALAKTLLALQQPDGLFWAKANYKAKYLEDNCEVYAGLLALKDLFDLTYLDSKGSLTASIASKALKAGMIKELWDGKSLWKVARFEDGKLQTADLNRWYPDMQCQFWPVLFGVVEAGSAQAKAVKLALQQHWSGQGHTNWATDALTINGGFVNADAAYGALLLGLRSDAAIYLKTVEAAKFGSARADQNFGWPYTPLDAGWMLLLCTSLKSGQSPASAK